MQNLLNGRQHRTSLIIKDHVIRYVEASDCQLSSIKRYNERFLPEGIIKDGQIVDLDNFQIILEECVEKWRIKRQKVFFTVPDTFIVIRRLSIPRNLTNMEIKGYLNFEIGESIHLPFKEPYFDFEVLGERDDLIDLLLFASPGSIVDEYKKAFEKVKLKPVVADLTSLSLLRLYERMDMHIREEHLLSVQFNLSSINITIFDEFKPLFTRHMKLNIPIEQWDIISSNRTPTHNAINWTGDEDTINQSLRDVITELERVSNFYRFSLQEDKAQVTKLLLNGENPFIQKLKEQCEQTFNVPIVMLKEDIISTTKGANIPQRFFDNVGLAIKREVL